MDYGLMLCVEGAKVWLEEGEVEAGGCTRSCLGPLVSSRGQEADN